MLCNDAVLGIECARLIEQGVGLLRVADGTGVGCALHEFGDVVFSGNDEGKCIILIVRVQVGSLREGVYGGGEIFALYLPGSFKIGVFRFASLLGREG